jgi:hypothetical protein
MAEEVAQNQPTEEGQVRGRLLVPDEIPETGNEVRMIEPNVKTETGQVISHNEAEEEVVDESANKPEVTSEPAPTEDNSSTIIETVEDPGEYVPKDYSFDVVVYDEEGKNGRTVNIKSVDQFEELMEKDPNLGSASALSKALRLSNKMDINEERDKTEFDAKKSEYAAAVQNQERQVQATTNMANEINYLVDSGDLPKVDSQYVDADWSDPEVAKHSGVKEQVALLQFMRDENNRRHRLGLPAMTSVLDAFNAYERANSKTKDIDAKKLAGQQRKDAASVVAPASPAATTNAPKGISVGRAGNLRDIGRLTNSL